MEGVVLGADVSVLFLPYDMRFERWRPAWTDRVKSSMGE